MTEKNTRGQWGSHTEFMLSCIGYCVSLGNIWRFPYLAYTNGGGAFLIPYLIMLVLAGIPLFMMELSFGQFAGLGPMTLWRTVPIMKGIGIGMCLVSFLVTVYYNVIVAYSFFYLFASFTSKLPWTECDKWWNKVDLCNSSIPDYNDTSKLLRAEEYWVNRVLRLNESSGIDDPGPVLWDLSLCLLLSWILVLVCLIKGIQSSGKVVYFTATFPYLVLIILLIRGCTLEGAWRGIRFYIRPVWSKLGTSKVWSDAATQIFYSLGVSFGSLITFASYNPFKNNVLRDTLIVTIGNCATSIFGGFAIFSVIGYMSVKLNVDVENVTDSGPGLAFVIYPQAVALMPVSPLWSVLFFFMLLTLGLDSQFAMVEAVLAGIVDELEERGYKGKKLIVTITVCVVSFLLGLLLVTKGGFYWFQLYNWYSAYYGLIALSLVFCIVTMWGYGFFFTYRWRFFSDIEIMLGRQPFIYFKAAWMLVTPATLLFVLIMAGIDYTPIYLGKYTYPKWADNLGICMSVSTCAFIPLYAVGRTIYGLVKGEPLKKLITPTSRWRPQDETIPYDNLYGNEKRVSPLEITSYKTTNGNSVDQPPVYDQSVDDNVIDPYPTKI